MQERKKKLLLVLDLTNMKDKNYRLTVNAIGYESTSVEVSATDKNSALTKFQSAALKKFAVHNDISMSDARGFGFISVEKV